MGTKPWPPDVTVQSRCVTTEPMPRPTSTTSRVQNEVGAMTNSTVPDRLAMSIDETKYWAETLPEVAKSLTHRTRWFNFASSFLSLVTGLSAWALIANSPELLAQITVTCVTLISGVLVLVPTAFHWRADLDEVNDLTPRFGNLYLRMLDSRDSFEAGQQPEGLDKLYQEFDELKARKDKLGLGAARPLAQRATAA